MTRPRLLITGGSSYLGQHLVPLAARSFDVLYTFYSNNPLTGLRGERVDLRDETAVSRLIQTFQPDAIIHTAASNRTPDMTHVIEAGARHVRQAADAVNARLVHISTDVIFDGKEGPYGETAVSTPISAYGVAKANAETIVAAYANHAIVRTSLIYGLKIMDRGTEWMAKALKAGQPVTLFTNVLRNPVWADTLCLACLELVQNEYRGILNVAGRQEMTRAAYALRLLNWWQVPGRDQLSLGLADGNKFPLDCRLDVGRATAVLKTPMLGLDEVLAVEKCRVM